MRVRMLEDAPGSPDGVTVNEYTEGETYNIEDELGATFVTFGFAEEVEHDDPAQSVKPDPEPRGADTEKLTGPKADKKATGPDENK